MLTTMNFNGWVILSSAIGYTLGFRYVNQEKEKTEVY